MPTLEENLKLLDSFASFKKNWNGRGADPISPTLVDKVKKLISGLDMQLYIFPTADGSIQLVRDEDLGYYVEFDIDESDKAELFVVNLGGAEATAKVSCSSDIINRAIHKYFLDDNVGIQKSK